MENFFISFCPWDAGLDRNLTALGEAAVEAAATQLARAVLLQLGPGDALWEWQEGQADKRWVRASLGVRKALCWFKTHCWFKSSLRRCPHRRMPCAPLNKERVGSRGGRRRSALCRCLLLQGCRVRICPGGWALQ